MKPLDTGTVVFVSAATVFLAAAAFWLWSGKTLGIAFRSRFIARRHQQPALYWASLAIFAGAGLFLLIVVISVRLQSG